MRSNCTLFKCQVELLGRESQLAMTDSTTLTFTLIKSGGPMTSGNLSPPLPTDKWCQGSASSLASLGARSPTWSAGTAPPRVPGRGREPRLPAAGRRARRGSRALPPTPDRHLPASPFLPGLQPGLSALLSLRRGFPARAAGGRCVAGVAG